MKRSNMIIYRQSNPQATQDVTNADDTRVFRPEEAASSHPSWVPSALVSQQC